MGTKLTEEKIEKFKETESDAEASYDFKLLAENVANAGDKDWAILLFKQAEQLAEETYDYQDMADSVANGDYLGDKKWARELYKKAEDQAVEDFEEYRYLADSLADDNYLKDKEWASKIYKKAEELAEYQYEYLSLADSVANDDYLGDKKWARELYKKAEELTEWTDKDEYEYLAASIEDENFLGDKKWAEEIRKKAMDNYKLIVAKSFDRGTSQYQGNEICIGNLSKKQSVEIVALLKNGTYLDSDYFNNFSQYNDLYHAHGILIGDTNDIYNLADDKDDLSKGSWEFLEGEEDISDIIVKDDLYLVTCRVEDVYFHAQLPAESKDIPANKTIELTAILDRINPMENIPSDTLSENLDDPRLFLFKGVKCEYGEFERLHEEEEGAGFIYNTYQMIFHKNELLILISNRDHWESQFPFQDTEDYCPYLVSENELDQDKLNKSIQKLEKVAT